MGHNNEVITKLFKQAKPVKVTLDNLPNIVDKIEQKAKVQKSKDLVLATMKLL